MTGVVVLEEGRGAVVFAGGGEGLRRLSLFGLRVLGGLGEVLGRFRLREHSL
jgi:hypothetical protein